MITLHVIVTNNTSVNLITEHGGGGGLRNRPIINHSAGKHDRGPLFFYIIFI